MKKVTIKEVSKLAEVSISTVSRAINNKAVASDKKKRIIDAMKKLDYVPNAIAQSLASKRSNTIGVLVNDLGSPFHGLMLNGIESVLANTNFHLVVSSGRARKDTEMKIMELLFNRRCDAYIVHPESMSDTDLLSWSRQGNIVVVDRFVAELTNVSIHMNNEVGGEKATRYLIDNGHKKIAHISGPLSMQSSRGRLHGYRQALEKSNIRYNELFVVEGSFYEKSGYAAMQRLLDRNLGITGLFVANDQMAAGALKALRDNKINIPEEISIIGFDDILYAQYLYPSLTTIKLPVFEMGQAAANITLELIEGNYNHGIQCSFEPQLIERDSVVNIT